MTSIPPAPQTRDLDAEQLADIERFEAAIAQYLAGEIDEDVFRVMRLNNGIYGQRWHEPDDPGEGARRLDHRRATGTLR